MFEQSSIAFLYAVSPVHMGSGQAIGVIDNPIQRERHTRHPNMAGSGIKGAFRHHMNNSGWKPEEVDAVFGPDSQSSADGNSKFAGAISFGDAQLVAFPVRSLKSSFAYITSPTALARLKRLASVAGVECDWDIPNVTANHCLVADADSVTLEGQVVLEVFEYAVDSADDNVAAIADWIAQYALENAPSNAYFQNKIRQDLVVLPDSDFSHFVENATVVEPHVRINDDTGTAEGGALFYTENLPPESIMVMPVFAAPQFGDKSKENKMDSATIINKVIDSIAQSALVQFGGDATTGRGHMMVHFTKGGNNGE